LHLFHPKQANSSQDFSHHFGSSPKAPFPIQTIQLHKERLRLRNTSRV
jgi:hypothetical protein